MKRFFNNMVRTLFSFASKPFRHSLLEIKVLFNQEVERSAGYQSSPARGWRCAPRKAAFAVGPASAGDQEQTAAGCRKPVARSGPGPLLLSQVDRAGSVKAMTLSRAGRRSGGVRRPVWLARGRRSRAGTRRSHRSRRAILRDPPEAIARASLAGVRAPRC